MADLSSENATPATPAFLTEPFKLVPEEEEGEEISIPVYALMTWSRVLSLHSADRQGRLPKPPHLRQRQTESSTDTAITQLNLNDR